MFPIRDHNPSGRTPYVTYGLIAANIAVFLGYWLTLDTEQSLNRFFYTWGLVPGAVMQGQGYLTILTSMFLHGGWMHIAGNMLFLWIYGDNLEDKMGHNRFLLFYLACGVAAAFLQTAADPYGWGIWGNRGCNGGIPLAVSQGAGRCLVHLCDLFSDFSDPCVDCAGAMVCAANL
jgi:membrane associated rhomboid family serine protease